MIEAWTRGSVGGTIDRVTRGSSPILVGRDDELRRLRGALASARTSDRPVILVSGEAGIGKSRLLAELEQSCATDPPGARPVRFLHAGCIEVGERLAYLPILDWLDDLRAAADPDLAAQAGSLLATFGGSLGETAGALDAPESASMGRGTRFGAMRDILVRAAADVDVVAVIDDLHWADRSTLDVISYLANRLARTGVSLIGAYRSEELHRRHPLTASLAELGRHAVQEHVRLEPLGPDDVARQIAAIEGVGSDARARRVVELADGNPFHVEELLALDRPGPLPSSLHDVLAARLDQVDDMTVSVLREAAVIGRRVDADLLTAVSRADADTVGVSLRAAVDARILVADVDGRRVRFRHALLREAVYDEVLPNDRLALHRRIATCLAERPELGDPTPSTASADLARHWLAAGALAESLAALLEAARLAAIVGAWVEGRMALEEALGLWDRIPDPLDVARQPRSKILDDASRLAWYEGDSRRALELNRAAQREPDIQADDQQLGRLAISEAWYHNDVGDSEAYVAAAERAVALISAEPPSPDRAMALGTLAAGIAITGRMSDALAAMTEATAVATAVGHDGEIAANLAFQAWMHADRGDESVAMSALADARAALERAERAAPPGTLEDAYFAFTSNAPWIWLILGYYEQAVEIAQTSLADARRRGLDSGLSALLWPAALGQYDLGRWQDALATLDEGARYGQVHGAQSSLDATRARIEAARGELATARTTLAGAVPRRGWADEFLYLRLASAWTELLHDDPRAAAVAVREVVDGWPDLDSPSLIAEVAWFAAWTAADLVARSDGDRGDDLAAYAHTSIAARRPDAAALGAHEILRWLDLADAELARRDGRDTPTVWAGLAERLEGVGNRPAALIARLREATATLAADDAEAAIAPLRAAIDHAEAMGATHLGARALAIAQAARLDLEGADVTPPRTPTDRSPAPADPWGLSDREREVLALLVEGRTNRQIGEALFISDKTASVHVTHILVKLGVSSRTEAALLALRAGMVGDRA